VTSPSAVSTCTTHLHMPRLMRSAAMHDTRREFIGANFALKHAEKCGPRQLRSRCGASSFSRTENSHEREMFVFAPPHTVKRQSLNGMRCTSPREEMERGDCRHACHTVCLHV